MRLPTWLRRKPPLPKRTPAAADLPETTQLDLGIHLERIHQLSEDGQKKLVECGDLNWVNDIVEELRTLMTDIQVHASGVILGAEDIKTRQRAMRATLGDILDLPEAGDR